MQIDLEYLEDEIRKMKVESKMNCEIEDDMSFCRGYVVGLNDALALIQSKVSSNW